MTAPTPEKIQRYSVCDGWPVAGIEANDDFGRVVLYSDHLRHLKLAQIAALEEMVETFKVRACPCGLQIIDKIAALRKEIEG